MTFAHHPDIYLAAIAALLARLALPLARAGSTPNFIRLLVLFATVVVALFVARASGVIDLQRAELRWPLVVSALVAGAVLAISSQPKSLFAVRLSREINCIGRPPELGIVALAASYCFAFPSAALDTNEETIAIAIVAAPIFEILCVCARAAYDSRQPKEHEP